MRTAIYCRISRDRDGLSTSLETQEEDCRAYIAARDWKVANVYRDDDVSAYKENGRRPAFDSLKEDVSLGLIDAVVVYRHDRLLRSMDDTIQWVKFCERTKLLYASCNSEADITQADGRLFLELVMAFGEQESDVKAERIKRKHQHIAKLGYWHGGPRPFGYYPKKEARGTTLVIDEDEAAIVREAAHRVLVKKESLYSICKSLNQRGVPTARGAAWRTQTLLRILTGATHAGYREHHEDLVPAKWEPILTEEDWENLKSELTQPGTGQRKARVAVLAGGIAICGLCGQHLHTQRKTSGRRVYACVPGPNKGGCGKINCLAEPMEQAVVDTVLYRLSQSTIDGGKDLDDLTRVDAELARVRTKLKDLAGAWADDSITMDEWQAAREPLQRKDAGLVEKRQALQTRRHSLGIKAPEALAESWDDLTLAQRQMVIRTVIRNVIVNPPERRGPKFDPERFDVDWLA